MKKIKIMLGLVFTLLATFTQAQNGLENVTVEKYYVSNATDATAADGDLSGSGFTTGTLPAGSVTYRVYADLLPGYNLQAIYGVASHALKVNTTTKFYNNSLGSISPTWNRNSVKNSTGSTLGLDSYFSLGVAASNAYGILKSEDNVGTGGANLFTVVSGNVMQNADASAGIALTTQDGYYYTGISTFPSVSTTPGLDLSVFNDGSVVGNAFTTSNGSIYVAGGVTGPIPATNRILIGQFTTDGIFSFELNLQVGTPTGGVQSFVANNATGAEVTLPTLTYSPPSVTITSPATTPTNVVTGTVVALAANASDVGGTITQVEFFDGNTSLGIDATSPYSINWTSTVGTHNITAKATDNDGLVATSSIVVINAANNQAPTITVSAPSAAKAGASVNITATVGDVDGSVTQVQFLVDNVSIGTDNTAPFSITWTATLGIHSIKGVATDNLGLTTTSSNVNINVVNNVPPTASITSTTPAGPYTAPAVITINAAATDPDGNVTQVEFFVNNVSIGIDASSPYSMNWTSTIGTANITVKSTDDNGAVTTSSVLTLDIADPNALPYKIVSTRQACAATSVCIPISAVATVDNVIGYDIVLNYDKNKVTPTGNITKFSSLVNSSYFDADNSIDAVNGKMTISLFFNSSAPSSAKFSGTGNLICVEFAETGIFNQTDSTVVSVSSLRESYNTGVVAKSVTSGKYVSFVDNNYVSTLKFWADNSPIQYDVANPNSYLITNIRGNNSSCSSLSATAVQPNLAGNFIHNIANGLYINIERDILSTTSVQPIVNGADALLARKLLVDDPSFIPNIYQVIAMDVNLDGVISAGDVSQINQRAVLILPEFKQAWNYNVAGVSNGQLSKDWLFIDSSRINTNPAYSISATFPLDNGTGFSKYRVPAVPFCLPVAVTTPSICPTYSNEVYKGVMMGDVNGSYQNIGHDGLLRGSGVTFDLSRVKKFGNMIDIPVVVSSSVDVNSLDFALQFDQTKLKYNSMVVYSSDIQAMDYFNQDDKTLRFTSNSFQKYDLSQPNMFVRFELQNATINETDFNNVKGYVNGNEVTASAIGSLTTGVSTIDYSSFVNVYPNPASSVLTVEATKNSTIQLFDILGKQVLLSSVYANEKKEINIENIASGIYMLKVYNTDFTTEKKIVIERK